MDEWEAGEGVNQQTRKRLIWADVVKLFALILLLLVQVFALATVPKWVVQLLTLTVAVVANSFWQRIRQRGSN